MCLLCLFCSSTGNFSVHSVHWTLRARVHGRGRSEQEHKRGEGSEEAGVRLDARGDARLHVRQEEAGRGLVVPPKRAGSWCIFTAWRTELMTFYIRAPFN